MRRFIQVVGLVVAGLVLQSMSALADVRVLQPSSQDAYISKDRPNRIAGASPTNTRIRVLASPPGTQTRRGLVQFPLASIPAGSTVTSAVVELYAGNNALNTTLVHGLHRVTVGWLQSAVKWNNQPPVVEVPSATAVVGEGRGFKSFTVTPDVQAAVSLCAADHGWMIKDQAETATNDAVNYIALEEPHPADQLNRPRMTVTFTPPPCATDADCGDGNFCTTRERCQGGVCVVDAVDCDDHDPCTDDICDCSSGCINAPICNDGFSCTIDTCDPVTLACTNTPVDSVCDGECTTGVCVADQDSLSVDPATGCQVTGVKPADTPCEDGNACTEGDRGDRCDANGQCVPGAVVVCAALDDCHGVGTCDPATGQCSNPVQPLDTPCDDGNACTAGDRGDRCDADGQCVPGPLRDCTPEDPCRAVGTCDPASGACVVTPQAPDCDDPVCVEDPACVEVCDNCVDDNADGLVDRADPQCAPYADGLGAGTGDPKVRGKAVTRCQKAIRTAGRSLANLVHAHLRSCADAVFQCVQQKPGDPRCLAKARKRCADQIAPLTSGPRSGEARAKARILRACGAKRPGLAALVSRGDLCGAQGLSFANEVEACGDPSVSMSDLLAMASETLVTEHRCRAAQVFAADVPRGAELLVLGGVDVTSVLCLGEGAQGGSLGLGRPTTTGRAAAKCQKAIGKAGGRFVDQLVRGYQTCADAVFQCLQRKPGDARCRTKAQAKCLKVTSALLGAGRTKEEKLRQAVARGCGSRRAGAMPVLALSDVRGVVGLGYGALEADCQALGVTSLASLDDVNDCLIRQHVCRASQILTSHMPRVHELVDLGGAELR